MKPHKLDTATTSTLIPLLKCVHPTTTHLKVLKEGAKRAQYESILDLNTAEAEDDFYTIQQESCEVVPVKQQGKKWVEVDWAEQPQPQKQNSPVQTSTAPVDTGFMALVRKLNAEAEGSTSKYTISDVARTILEHFPEKEIKSVKRICYNIAKKTSVKWKSSSVNTGYMNTIDKLLTAGNLTTRQIGEKVSHDFNKDLSSAKTVVRARMKVLGQSVELKVPKEDDTTRMIDYLTGNENKSENSES